MAEITLNSLKQYLKQQSKEELIKQIAETFAKFDHVKDYYKGIINPEGNNKVLQKYRTIIKNEFFPSRGFGNARLSVAKKAISDYMKVSPSKEGVADIMLFYVEMGVKFTNAYGDINESFYNSMESMYERMLKYVTDNNFQEKFQSRCKKIVDDTSGIGWGFHDGLSDAYYEYFGEV